MKSNKKDKTRALIYALNILLDLIKEQVEHNLTIPNEECRGKFTAYADCYNELNQILTDYNKS